MSSSGQPEASDPVLREGDLVDDRELTDVHGDRLDHERIVTQLVDLVTTVDMGPLRRQDQHQHQASPIVVVPGRGNASIHPRCRMLALASNHPSRGIRDWRTTREQQHPRAVAAWK